MSFFDNFFLYNNPYPQILTSPSERLEVEQGKFTAQNHSVLFTKDGSKFESFTAVTMDVEGEKGMVFYTRNINNNNS